MTIVRVQSRGQITIPQRIRDRCGIKPGSELRVYIEDASTFGCHVLPEPPDLGEMLERFTVDGPSPDLEQLREEMGDDLAREYIQPSDTQWTVKARD